VAPFPKPVPAWEDDDAERTMEMIIDLDTRVRNVRAAVGIGPGQSIRLLLIPGEEEVADLLRRHERLIAVPTRAERLEFAAAIPEGLVAARGVSGGVLFAIPLEGLLDVDAERRRIRSEIDKARNLRKPHAAKLENRDFLERAPAAVVEKTRGIVAEIDERIARLEETREALGGE
jgi:valyl-tRNA synthetase